MADAHKVLIDPTHGKPDPIPEEDKGADNDGAHAGDIEDLVEIAKPASEPHHDMDERRRKQPHSSKDDRRQPDEMSVVLLGGQERDVPWERGDKPHQGNRQVEEKRVKGGPQQHPIEPPLRRRFRAELLHHLGRIVVAGEP